MSPVLIGILAYLVAQIGIGVWYSRRIRTVDDYLLGGRRLGVPLVAGVERFAVLLAIPSSLLWAAQIRAFGQILSTFSEIDIGIVVTLAAVVSQRFTS